VTLLSKHEYNEREDPTLSKFLKLWYHDKVQWALLFHKRHLKERGLLKAYKAHNPVIPWQCGTLNTDPHVWHYCPNTCTTGGKTQHYPRSSSRVTLLSKHVYNGRIDPTLSKVTLTCDIIVQTRVQREERPNIIQGHPHVWHYCPNTCTTEEKTQHCLKSWSFDTMIKSNEPYSSTKGTLRKEVCSRLIKPTTQTYPSNVGLLKVHVNATKHHLKVDTCPYSTLKKNRHLLQFQSILLKALLLFLVYKL
jgi:hypothetical protein